MIQGSTIHDGGRAAKISTWWDGIGDPFAWRAGPASGTDDTAGQAVDACVACYHQCRECCYASLMREGDDSRAIERWLDCAALCMTSAMLIARGSDLAAAAATLCARACDRCLDEMDHLSDCPWEDCIAGCNKAAAGCREFAAASQQV